MEPKIGDWIRKTNYTRFKPYKKKDIPIFLLESLETPVIKVDKVNNYNLGYKYINDMYCVLNNSTVTLTQEEALVLLKLWNECQLSETEQPIKISSCIREDNGNPKQKYPSFASLKESLFIYCMKVPSGNFSGYKCGICDSYHIGKRTQN